VRACQKGDRGARHTLYQSTADEIMNICIRYTNDHSMAKDAFQDTYLKIFSKITQYKSAKGTFMAWAARIAVHASLHVLRHHRKITYVESIHQDMAPTVGYDIYEALSAQELMDIVNELPDGYRLVFNMYVVEGFDHNEIGEKLGISAATSRSQLARARAILRKKSQIRNKVNYGQAQ